MKAPPIQYADSPGGKIAYQVVGDGPIDLVWVGYPNLNIDIVWDQPLLPRLLTHLAAFSRLIIFNPRGVELRQEQGLGLSR